MSKKTATERAKQCAQADRVNNAGKKMNGDNLPFPLPAKITLLSSYGFLDEDGALNMWAPGQEVEDADEILILLERNAPIVFDNAAPAQEPVPVAIEVAPAPAQASEPEPAPAPAPEPELVQELVPDPALPADEPVKTE